MKIILIIAADISAGKDTAARYIVEKYGFERHTLSDILRGEARLKDVPPTRENLAKIADELRKKEGPHALINRVIKKIKKDKVVIVGVRDLGDLKRLCKEFGKEKIKLIYITADPKIRFERMRARGRTGDPKTFEEFLAQEAEEHAKFNFKALKKAADFKIENNGTLEEFHNEIDRIVSKVL